MVQYHRLAAIVGCLLVVAFSTHAKAQDPQIDPANEAQIPQVELEEPPLEQAPPPVPARYFHPIIVRLSGDLDEQQTAALSRFIEERATIVIGDKATYELAPNPEFPEDILFLPIKGLTPETQQGYDKRLHVEGPMSVAEVHSYFDWPPARMYSWATNVPKWIDLGSVASDHFGPRLDLALAPLLRRYNLLRMRQDTNEVRTSTCLADRVGEPGQCPLPINRRPGTVAAGSPLYIQVVAEPYDTTPYITVIAIAPDYSVKHVFSGRATNTVAATSSDDAPVLYYAEDKSMSVRLEEPGRYEIITIASEDPVDTGIFELLPGQTSEDAHCVTEFEQRICAAVLGEGADFYSERQSIAVQEVTAVKHISMPSPLVLGKPTDEYEAPWQAQLFFRREGGPFELTGSKGPGEVHRQNFEKAHKCGGTYIGKGFVLTSAHCIPPNSGSTLPQHRLSNLRVRLGTRDIAKGGVAFRIESVAVHERERDADRRADVAVIKLAPSPTLARLEAGPLLKKIDIAVGSAAVLPVTTELKVTGWGFTGATDEDSNPLLDISGATQRNPRILQKLYLQVAREDACDIEQFKYYDLSESLCVKAIEEGSDACYKDSGGPLVREYEGSWYLVGIVTAGVGCASGNYPSLYMRTSEFRRWVEQAKTRLRTAKPPDGTIGVYVVPKPE